MEGLYRVFQSLRPAARAAPMHIIMAEGDRFACVAPIFLFCHPLSREYSAEAPHSKITFSTAHWDPMASQQVFLQS